MSRTFVRQDTQIRQSDVYDDTIAAGQAALETAAANIEDDLNSLRSQVSRILDDQAGAWYDDIPTVNAKKRSLLGLNTDLDDIEEKRLLFRVQSLADITVGASNNYVVLGSGEIPSITTAAVGAASTTEGTVVAAHGGTFGSHALDEVAGSSAISPKNLCIVRDGSTGDPILSDNRTVYALIQSENATDGHTITTTTPNRVQLSFVRINSTGDDLEAVPVADIENASINYAYVRRVAFDNVPEEAFLSGTFIDQAGSVDVTLQNAIDNQSGAVGQTSSIQVNIADAQTWGFYEPSGTTALFEVVPTAGGDTVRIQGDTLDVNSTTVDFAGGVTVDSAGQDLQLGVNAGVIESTSTNDLRVLGAGELYLDDGNQTGSTWAQTDGIKLSETTTEWDSFEANFGEVSLLDAMNQLYASAGLSRTKGVAVLTANVPPDTNVTGAGGTPNLDAQLPDYSSATFLTDVDIYLNGVLLRNGADAAANHDVYPGTTPANGDLMFEFNVKGGGNPDVITMIVWG